MPGVLNRTVERKTNKKMIRRNLHKTRRKRHHGIIIEFNFHVTQKREENDWKEVEASQWKITSFRIKSVITLMRFRSIIKLNERISRFLSFVNSVASQHRLIASSFPSFGYYSSYSKIKCVSLFFNLLTDSY